MDELNYEKDTFEDILSKDSRYNARAYTLLMDVVNYLTETGGRASGAEILDEFKSTALDHFGPLSYTVLTEWGLACTEDIGEMMHNLVESFRISKEPTDDLSEFNNGYDFREAFHQPYET